MADLTHVPSVLLFSDSLCSLDKPLDEGLSPFEGFLEFTNLDLGVIIDDLPVLVWVLAGEEGRSPEAKAWGLIQSLGQQTYVELHDNRAFIWLRYEAKESLKKQFKGLHLTGCFPIGGTALIAADLADATDFIKAISKE